MTMIESGVPWIGKIPYEWMIRPVKALYSLTTGFTPSSENDSLYDDEGETWVTISDMKSDVVTDSKQKIAKSVAEQHRKDIAKAGSLLYSFKLSVGTVAFAGKDLFTNEAIAAFQPKTDNADLRYLKYASSLIVGNANTNIYGATIMNQKLILNAPLPLPPLEEQRAIYNYLDDRCSKLDEIITEAEKSIEEYKELKQAVIFEAVTRGLDKNAPMKDSGVYCLGAIPQLWKAVKTKYLVRIENGSDPLTEGNIPVYGSGAKSFKTCGEFKEGPTVLLGRKGATLHIPHFITGRYWNVDTAFNTIPISEDINLKYFYYAASCFDYKAYISQTTLPGMTQTSYRNMKIALPDLSIQNSIVNYLDNKVSDIDVLISEKQSLIEDLKAYKKSLIYEVVTGKRRVV